MNTIMKSSSCLIVITGKVKVFFSELFNLITLMLNSIKSLEVALEGVTLHHLYTLNLYFKKALVEFLFHSSRFTVKHATKRSFQNKLNNLEWTFLALRIKQYLNVCVLKTKCTSPKHELRSRETEIEVETDVSTSWGYEHLQICRSVSRSEHKLNPTTHLCLSPPLAHSFNTVSYSICSTN